MSGTTPTPHTAPRAKLRRPRFQFVWLIPIVAAMIAGYLGYRTLIEQGPLLTLTFATADGLQAGQTQVKYKAVALGTVESIDLAKDNSHVIVKVRMNNVGARFLNSHARYWVERPRLNFAHISGIKRHGAPAPTSWSTPVCRAEATREASSGWSSPGGGAGMSQAAPTPSPPIHAARCNQARRYSTAMSWWAKFWATIWATGSAR